jgi:lipopolysaccharide export system protein LptA
VTRRMSTIGPLFAAVAVTAAALLSANALAQQQGPPNALQGFSLNRDKPVKIQAASLEVRDKDKVATFSGDVHVVQGDTDLRCKTLVVYYEDGSAKTGLAAAQPGPGGGGQIRRMEASGGVVVNQKEQVATGDRGEFDMRTNTVTLIGNVVVTKGQDVLKGQRLIVNLASGVSRMESGGGRVEGLFQSKGRSDQNPGSGQNPGLGLPRPARPN